MGATVDRKVDSTLALSGCLDRRLGRPLAENAQVRPARARGILGMTDVGFLWLSGGLAVVGIAALATAIAIFWRRRGAESPAPVGIVPAPPCVGPIARLSFVQSLNPVLFAEAAEEEVLAHARVHLRDLIADGTVITLQTLRQWGARSEMVVAASAEATKAARPGATVIGEKGLPFVRGKTGQFREVMKEVGRGRKAIAGAAAVSTIVISAAHMISAADLARTLKQVDQKLDLLLAYVSRHGHAFIDRALYLPKA
jgi:hypothetical protein